MDFPKVEEHHGLDITFASADVDFVIAQAEGYQAWLQLIIDAHSAEVGRLHYIFCSDTYLLKLNVEYLEHDTLTDIITFPLGDDPIESEIYISIDRVQENADQRNIEFKSELARVIVHGLLHLLGMKDKTDEEKLAMRRKEDECMAMLEGLHQ